MFLRASRLRVQRSRVHGRGILVDDMRVSHSCDPNCFLVSSRLVSIRPILFNEEVTVNVSLVEYDLGARALNCSCGSSTAGRRLVFCSLSDAEAPLDDLRRSCGASGGYISRLLVETSCELISIRANGDMGQSTFAAKPIRKGLASSVHRSHDPFPTVYTILLAL